MRSANRVHITQGERGSGTDPDLVISTILGSCVSCCLWDPVAGAGGMNHMLLTVSTAKKGFCNLAGINAMELLINDILKLGGRRDRLRAKAFGGSRMVSGLSDIGRLNSDFTLDFLRQEGITCEGHSLGGSSARHLMFWPASGRVLQKVREDAPEETPAQVRAPENTGNDLELF
ncbi:chemotaxis protein CheD [Roseobacter ponti]|uniref:Probable chemoreceptor glutamine deamidase CheD n=1 Tax=Roseobacter ponti TaxID=1891787 RepID=A0A858SR32_9RHOB|nr:chemotaxis protein CheD [Roseobacter ponti]QJF51174.1 chemotaxis protein CheD [Roseobacter ponti]